MSAEHERVESEDGAALLCEFSERLAQSYEETNLLYRLSRLLNCSSGTPGTVEVTCEQICEVLPFRWVAVSFRTGGVLPALSGRLVTAGALPRPESRFGRLAAALTARCAEEDWARVLDPGHSELAALAGSEVIAVPLVDEGRSIGALLAGNKSGPDPGATSVETQFLEAAANFLGVYHQNAARLERQQAMFLGTVQALTAAIDAKDRYTRGHSERVAMLAAQLGRAMGLPRAQVEHLRIGGLVHDVGKIGVAEAVLRKPGRLTEQEFAQIKRHPVIGAEILKDIPPLAEILPAVRSHHERWDGGGYPDGLRGEAIPLYGRALACADAFDAMSSNRAYRPAMSRAQVLAEFRRCAGGQFDPMIAPVFVELDFTAYDRMVRRHRRQDAQAA